MQVLGGSVYAENGEEKGTVIIMQLPIKQAALPRAVAQYVTRGEQGLRIEISTKCKTPNTSSVHELSHWLDHLVFGDGTTFGTSSEAYKPIQKAIEKTGEYKQLRAIKQKGKLEDGEYKYELNGEEKKMTKEALDYYLKPEEQFARLMEAYAAWDEGEDFAKELAAKRNGSTSRYGFDLYPKDKEMKSLSKKLSKYLRGGKK